MLKEFSKVLPDQSLLITDRASVTRFVCTCPIRTSPPNCAILRLRFFKGDPLAGIIQVLFFFTQWNSRHTDTRPRGHCPLARITCTFTWLISTNPRFPSDPRRDGEAPLARRNWKQRNQEVNQPYQRVYEHGACAKTWLTTYNLKGTARQWLPLVLPTWLLSRLLSRCIYQPRL